MRIDAQGRMLVLHTATGYEERGVSVTASVGGGPYEPGLTASLRPQWGAPGYGAESLWQDHFQAYTDGAGRNDAGLDARLGYGLRLPGGRLVTPFGGYGQMGSGRRVQVGANLGMLGLIRGRPRKPGPDRVHRRTLRAPGGDARGGRIPGAQAWHPLYRDGQGVRQDHDRAVAWFRRAQPIREMRPARPASAGCTRAVEACGGIV